MSRSPSHSGPSQRMLRVGELIRRTLSEILQQGDLHDPELSGVSITVGEVRVTPDLKRATAYVLPLGGGNREGILAALRRNKPEIRHMIAREMTLKHVPDLKFEIDETFDRIDATRRMFSDERVRRDLESPEDAPE
ncbi:30S ribosome-binding factor RbfA [Rubellimicrobium roseum]|uniref:Ribosome-binding factor A n=1 Tax=Rubellimicrobium roseum TaxID=687525 RepID=A0A5C4NCG3_9RHOB|nr:30S ribosome-binding factor RbfA [Rubellimicrobium roseum]TNC72403.1 30S ribosome-binding factor RbfA [Rubellimicrobium roseum]